MSSVSIVRFKNFINRTYTAGYVAGLCLLSQAAFAANNSGNAGDSIDISGAGIGTSAAQTQIGNLRTAGTTIIMQGSATFREWLFGISTIAALGAACAAAWGHARPGWWAKIAGGMMVLAGISTIIAILTGVSVALG